MAVIYVHWKGITVTPVCETGLKLCSVDYFHHDKPYKAANNCFDTSTRLNHSKLAWHMTQYLAIYIYVYQ